MNFREQSLATGKDDENIYTPSFRLRHRRENQQYLCGLCKDCHEGRARGFSSTYTAEKKKDN